MLRTILTAAMAMALAAPAMGQGDPSDAVFAASDPYLNCVRDEAQLLASSQETTENIWIAAKFKCASPREGFVAAAMDAYAGDESMQEYAVTRMDDLAKEIAVSYAVYARTPAQ